MKAVFPKENQQVSVREVDIPTLTAGGDVLVKMRACGLCGSDLEKIYGEYSMKSGRLGHEPAGEIVAIGKEVRDFAPGDRVFLHHHVACYSCHYCNHGDYTMCPKYQESNISPCGLAEKVLVPEWNVSRGGLVKLPDAVSYEEASLIEPLACCLRAWEKCSFQQGDDVLVMGAGPTGLMHIILAKLFGARKLLVTDVNTFRLDFAKRLGATALQSVDPDLPDKIRAETQARGVDVCVVATGSTKAITQSFGLTRRGGEVILFGVPPKGAQMPVDFGQLYSSEVSIIPTYAASEKETRKALELIENRRINVTALITHRFDLSNAPEAIKCAREAKDAVKVVVTNDA